MTDVITRLAAANPVPHDGPLHSLEPGLRPSRRSVLGIAAAAVSAMALAITAVVLVVNPSSGNASPVREATPLDQANIPSALRKSITDLALKDNVDPATVVELGASGTGGQHHAVLAGTDPSGATLLSFLDGFGMSAFVPGEKFAKASNPMFVSDSVSGPSTEARIVGVVGITTREIVRVAVQLANGTTLTLPLDQAPGIAYDGFSYVSSDASTFPAMVTAYDRQGQLASKHKVDATALCESSHPNCGG